MTKQILVTNDDGVLALGLLALAREMRKLGKFSVLAPDRNWSGGGHVQLDLTAYRALTDLNTWHWDEAPYEAALLEKSEKLTLFHSD